MKNRKRIAAILAAAVMSLYVVPSSVIADEQMTQNTNSQIVDGSDYGQTDEIDDDQFGDGSETNGGTDSEVNNETDGEQNGDGEQSTEEGSEDYGISPMSLLPIEEHNYEEVTIDRTTGVPEGLEGYTEYAYYVKEVLGELLLKYGEITDKENCDKIIMYSDDGDSYTKVDWNGIIDPDNVYRSYDGNGYFYYTYAYFIVGNGDQLSMENTRYDHVRVKFNTFNSQFENSLDFKFYNENNEDLTVYDKYIASAIDQTGELFRYYSYTLSSYQVGKRKLPGVLLSLPNGYSADNVKVYEGLIYDEANLASGKDVTAEILDDGTEKKPYQLTNDYASATWCYKDITLAVTLTDGSTKLIQLEIYVNVNSNYVSLDSSSGVYGYIQNDNNIGWFSGNFVFYGRKSFDEVNNAYLKAYYYDYTNNEGKSNADAVEYACFGNYNSIEEAKAAGEKDITKELFGYQGAKVDFSRFTSEFSSSLDDGTAVTLRKIDVTTFDTYGIAYHNVYYFAISPISAETVYSPSNDTYFNIQGAKIDGEGEYKPYLDDYRVSSLDDDYYKNGYQTVFILDDESPVSDGTTIYPTFNVSNGVRINRIDTSEEQISGESPVTFNAPETMVKYYASSESGTNLKNYWVTFITQQEGAHLFVNAANVPENYGSGGKPRREVFLNTTGNFKHDIFIANTGKEPLTGITASLSSDTVGVKLDPYWQITENSTGILNPFDSLYYKDIDNIAKIRLIPEDENDFTPISGTLTISSANGGSYEIELSGIAGVPKITTTQDDIYEGVKYVPYSCFIGTNNMYETNAMKFTISGDLPEGLSFNANTGEIYGVPKEFGVFYITVSATYTGNVPTDSNDYTSEASYVLIIKDNEDANVDGVNADEQGEELTKSIDKYLTIYYNGRNGNYPASIDRIVTENGNLIRDEIFESQGKYNEDFMYFYLDGEPLAEGQEFNAVNGSTVITLNNQTFMGLPIENNSRHTLAAEFREGKDTNKKLTRSAQNVYLKYVNIGNDSEEENNNAPSKTPTPINPTVNYNDPANGTNGGAVNVTAVVTDKNGNAVSGLSLELHSKVLKAKTNADGTASFSNVNFGRHTLYAKDQNGKTLAKKEFTIKSGNKTEISGNIITAKAGETVYLAVQYDDSALTILNVAAEDVSAAAGIESETESIGTLYGIKENFALVIIAMLISVAAMTAAFMIDEKNNR